MTNEEAIEELQIALDTYAGIEINDEALNIAIRNLENKQKSRENIQWLIDQYQHEVETIEQDLAEIKRDFYLSGKLAAYNKVIKDLQGVLSEEVEE